ncbi:MAG TPA: hypothetical protein VK589_25690 [Chryseolinea sp.]|nr:hypothetical protein [Chryseolinea sp.]
MKRIFWVYFALLIFGLLILAWPEENDLMMIQLSATHGPSKMDLAGILVIMMGYIPMVKEVWKQSSSIKRSIGEKNWNLLILITLIAMAAIAWSLYAANDITLWISVMVATLTQGVLVRIAYRTA